MAEPVPATDGVEAAGANEAEQPVNLLDPDTLQTLFIDYAGSAVVVLLILIVAFIVSSWASGLVTRWCRNCKLDETLSIFFGKLARWGLLGFALLMCLERFDIETTSIAAVLAAAGFAVGLAFQGTLANFASGIMLLIFRPFKVGDFIRGAGEFGVVKEVDLFTTTLDTPDRRAVIIPNGDLFGKVIENFTSNDYRRVDIDVGVSYGADIDETRKVLTESIKDVPDQVTDEEPVIMLIGLGGSSVDWQVRLWATPENYWDVKDAGTRAVKYALDKAGISIPFPQLDVHLDKLSAD